MRKYEARFFPPHLAGEAYVVIAHLVWKNRQTDHVPDIQLAPELSTMNAPATLLATLRHLVLKTGANAAERLASTQNPFWSFVEIELSENDADGSRPPDAPSG